MADPGFPPQHTTTTTVTSSSTTVQRNIRYDPLYIRTIPGILKIAQIVSKIITVMIVLWVNVIVYKHLWCLN